VRRTPLPLPKPISPRSLACQSSWPSGSPRGRPGPVVTRRNSAVVKFALFYSLNFIYSLCAAGGTQSDGLRRTEGELRNKWAVSLICLLLFIAAVDTIPDPLAINPPTNHGSNVSAVHFRGSFTLLEKEWGRSFNSIRSVRVEWSSFRRVFDDEPAAICPLPRVHVAADASPPSFS
jgi:hypothetical protein